MQERQESGRTRPAIHHRDDKHFLLNTGSLHNYEYIKALLSDDLRGSVYVLTPEHAAHIREQASDKVRDQRQQRAEAQKALAMEKIMGTTRSSDSSDLIQSMHNDGELLEVFTDVLAEAPSGLDNSYSTRAAMSEAHAPAESDAMDVDDVSIQPDQAASAL
jgi:sRNA-binding protein